MSFGSIPGSISASSVSETDMELFIIIGIIYLMALAAAKDGAS